MDILRILSSPDLEVRKKSLELVVDLMTSRNCEEVSSFSISVRLVLHSTEYLIFAEIDGPFSRNVNQE